MSIPCSSPNRLPFRAGFVLLGLSMLPGCGDTETTPAVAFANLEIQVAALDGRDVQLRDRRAELPEEGVSLLLDDLHLTGTLDDPSRPVTSGIVYVTRSGEPLRTELVVARQDGDAPMVHVATTPLGERMRIEGIRYQDGSIVIHTMEYGPEDPPCCPGIPVLRHFRLSPVADLEEQFEPEGT